MSCTIKVKCPICGQEISKCNFSKHERRHRNHPETFEKPKYSVNHEGLTCQFCGKECKNNNSLRNHERLCKSNPNRQVNLDVVEGFNNKGRIAWNKGLTKETDPRVKLLGETLSKRLKGKQFSIETRQKISKSIKKAYDDGRLGKRLHRLKHDKNLYGTYKGYECDSSWELAFVIYNIDHNIKFERNTEYFNYEFNGRTHKYFPDFIINNTFIEIKGNLTKRDEAKFNCFPKNKELVVIDGTSIKPYIEYCKQKYGDFTLLYDRTHPCFLDKLK